MAISQAITSSFKAELLAGKHDFTSGTGHTFKIALYTSSATLNAATTDYTATGETSGTGYVAGGSALTSNGIATSDVEWIDHHRKGCADLQHDNRGRHRND